MEVEVKNPTAATHSQNGTLSFEQIKDIVGNGWAVIKNPVREGSKILKGELYFHSLNEKEALDELSRCKDKLVSFRYFGERDPNIVYLL